MTRKLLRSRGPDHRQTDQGRPRVGQQADSTPGYPSRPVAAAQTTGAGHSWQPPRLRPRQYLVLQAVADHRIQRSVLLGTFEPHLLDGKNVIWTLRALVVRGLVQLAPIGPPQITRRGRRTLDSPD